MFKKIQRDAAEHGSQEQSQYDVDILAKIVDEALKQYDTNNDGYIYYSEFHRSYKKL